MKAWIIEKSSMGGSELIGPAFIYKSTCDLICEELTEEWWSYTPVPCDGEEINKNRIIIDGVVYQINRADGKDIIKDRALKKLTPEERTALGV